MHLISCLQDTVINSAPMIVNYMNKIQLYYQCPPRRVKDINMSYIENTLCVRSVMNVTPVFQIEREPCVYASILKGLVMKFTYIHAQSYLMNIGARQNMHLFIIFTSNLCINKKIWGSH